MEKKKFNQMMQAARGWKMWHGRKIILPPYRCVANSATEANLIEFLRRWEYEVQLVNRGDFRPTNLEDPKSNPCLIVEIPHHFFEKCVSFYPGGHYSMYENFGRISSIFLVSDLSDKEIYCIGEWKMARYVFGKLLRTRTLAKFVRGIFRDYLRKL